MADVKGEDLKLGFDGSIRLEFHGAKVTSDAGLLAYRDLDEALVLFDSVPSVFHDSRTGRNIQHDLTALLRQSVYSRLAGYEDVNDAHRLSVAPTMRRITGKKIDNKNAASANTMGRFETQMLSVEDNLKALSEVNGRWVERALQKTTHRRIILDMDSSASPVHGEQEASGYNGHFGCTCYHPLFCFNQFGDCEGSLLRPGNVHSADRWKELLEPIVARYERKTVRQYFRGDAAFAKPEIYEYLEEKGFLYAIRLPANQVLQEKIEHLLTRPVGRPPRKPVVWFADFKYQAASWDRPRRVIAKVEWHRGELFPRVGFILTNRSARAQGVVHFYNGRGRAEQWIKEGKYFSAPSGSSQKNQTLVPSHPIGQVNQDRSEGGPPCLELDAVVLPALCPASGEVGSVCFGLQPGHFSAPSGSSQKNQTLVPSHPIGQVDQDRSEGGPP